MPFYASDGLICLTILASAYYAYQTIPEILNHTRNLAACPEPPGPGPRKQLQKDAENAISIDTLRVLSDGHSYDLRASTIKIVASRTLKSRTKRLLLQDLSSTDKERRYNAITAIFMLIYNPALKGKHTIQELTDYDSFYSVITALRNVLKDHNPKQRPDHLLTDDPLYPEPDIPPSPIRPSVRPTHEQSLLWILRAMLGSVRPYDPFSSRSDYHDNLTCALQAGLVTRWLKDYPFPCVLPENSKYNFKKSDVASLCEERAWGSDDIHMAWIFKELNRNALGLKQLREAGLRGSSYTEVEDIENIGSPWRRFPSRLDTYDSDNDIRMVNGESTAGAATPPPIALARHQRETNDDIQPGRTHALSPEEESLRRRRREAFVVAEPGTPLGPENIFQRTNSSNSSGLESGNNIPDEQANIATPDNSNTSQLPPDQAPD